MPGLGHDIRYGLRMLAKSPGFSAVAIATLSLGIGANTAILSVGHSVLYRPLPYKKASDLAIVWGKDLKRGWNRTQLSVPDFLDYQRLSTSFQAMSGYTWTDYMTFSLSGENGAQRIRGAAVMPGLFRLLDAHPFIGREFLPEEFIGDKHVALLGYETWRTHFGANRDLVGRTIRVNREPYTVIGILPEGCEIPVLDAGLGILVPLRLDSTEAQSRAERLVVGVGLLKPDVKLQTARVELDQIGKRLGAEFPEDALYTAAVETLRDSEGLEDAKAALPVFLVTVLLMMLIAAANAAGILLSRFANRSDELVVRSALGATNWRVVRQLLIESLLLAGLAGILAVLVAEWVGDLLISYEPFYMPVTPKHILSEWAVAAVVVLTTGTGLIFGLLPALTASRMNLSEAMNRASRRIGSGWRQGQMRNALIAVEVAISVALLAGAGLMINTVVRIARVDIGFDARGLALARISLDSKRYPPGASQLAFYQTLAGQLAAQPEVYAATVASHFSQFDPSGYDMGNPVRIPRRTLSAHEAPTGTETTVVAPGFFSTVGMRLLRGRDFSASEAVPAIVVDQVFADKFFPHEDALGKQVMLLADGMRMDEAVKVGLRTIVGVVAPVRRISYSLKPFPQAYVPLSQNPVPAMYAIVRARNGNGAAAIRRAVARLDSELPVFWADTATNWVDKFYAGQRFELLALGAFAIVALLVSASGLYSVVSYRVAQRTRELGIRLALGASRRNVEWMVLRQAAGVIGVGLLVGLAGAGAIGRVLSKLLFGVQPNDPLTLIAGTGLVLTISLLAVYVPSRRGARMEPLAALRYE